MAGLLQCLADVDLAPTRQSVDRFWGRAVQDDIADHQIIVLTVVLFMQKKLFQALSPVNRRIYPFEIDQKYIFGSISKKLVIFHIENIQLF